MNEWKPIETAPKNVPVLAYWALGSLDPCNGDRYAITVFTGTEWLSFSDMDNGFLAPSFWMPLPKPPEL